MFCSTRDANVVKEVLVQTILTYAKNFPAKLNPGLNQV